MKSYEDIAERVFRKGDAILEKKHRRTAIIKRTSFVVSGLCAVIIAGFGLWNNYSLKNAINNEYPAIIDSQDVSENDIPIITQTSDFFSEKNSNALYVTVSVAGTAGNPDVFSSVSRVSENVFPDYNSDVTSTSDEFFTVSTITHSEDSQKTIQTSVSTKTQTSVNTTIQTSVSTTAQTSVNTTIQTSVNTTAQTSVSTTTQTYSIVTDTTNPPPNIDDERSLNMKKLASFISALTLSVSAMPTISNASGVPFSVNQNRYWPGERQVFAKMESGELDVDINGNGEFDIMDCYLLDSYISEYYSYKENIEPEIIQRIESIADYDGDGAVDFDDTLRLMRYFIVSGNIRNEYLDPAYYDPDLEPLTTEEQLINFGIYKEIQAYVFPMRMFYHVNYLNAEYYIIDELYQNGTIDLDINGNGQLDVDDIYYMSIFFTEKKDSEVAKQLLTEEEYQKCWDFSFHYSEHLVPHHYSGFDMQIQVASYILNHIEVKPEYFTVAYYKENIDNYQSEYCTAEVMREAALQIGIEVSDNIGPTYDLETDRNLVLLKDIFNPYFESFCSDIENGVRPVPDVNMDGVVDYTDYFDMNIYWSDIMTGCDDERSILPPETWNTIDEYYGMPDGNIPILYELSAAQLYIIEHTEEIDDIDSVYNAYVESLIKSDESNLEPLNYNENVQILDVDTKRSGDANEDGKVNLADAVLIMQALSNPDEYQLTTKGQFNADVYNTGDGITANDALQIQMWTINIDEPLNA
ncbi:MAG: hypothetical protein K2K89_06705 [Ruminococcus sp.]|nr:hypothetical protein [Ruminococcus sp.]